MRKILSLLLVFSLLLVPVVVYAEEIGTEVELSEETFPIGSYIAPKEYTVDFVENESIMLFSAEPEKPLFEYLYEILYSCDSNYYQLVKYYTDETNYKYDYFMQIDLAAAGYTPSLSEIRTIYELFTTEYGELLLSPDILISSRDGNDDDSLVYTVGFQYISDISNIENIRNEMNNKVNPFITEMQNSSLSELEKVLLTHDYIAQNAIYQPDESLKGNPEYHTLYSAIVDGVTVCQGYTLAMCYILNKLGIDCVACICHKIKHVWNCVKVDGKWYHVDLTWDDMDGTDININEKYSYIRYSNFLLSSTDTLKRKNTSGVDGLPVTKDNFIYLSGKVTNETSDNNEFLSGYMFNSIRGNFIAARPNVSGDIIIYEHIEPVGCSYSNGRIIHKIRSRINNIYEKEYTFLYDSLIASDFVVSQPYKSSGRYKFLFRKENEALNNTIKISGLMKNIKGDGFAVNSFNVTGNALNRVYCFVSISDNTEISQIDGANETEFFFWDSNMRPLTQKTVYENQ